MDLHGELVKVLDELAEINQKYLDASPAVKKAQLARLDDLATRVEELTASIEATVVWLPETKGRALDAAA